MRMRPPHARNFLEKGLAPRLGAWPLAAWPFGAWRLAVCRLAVWSWPLSLLAEIHGPLAVAWGGLGCSSTPLAQAVSYIIEASGNGQASPGFSNGTISSRSAMHGIRHGTSKYFVGTVNCHCLCPSRKDRRWTVSRNCSRIEMGVCLVVSASLWRSVGYRK